MATKKNAAVSALAYLANSARHAPGPICVVGGDDAFLRHEVSTQLARQLQGEAEDSVFHQYDGRQAILRDVLDALAERSLFGGENQVVFVEEADPFVREYRSQLENYVEKPIAASVLVLQVQSWPGNTRLAKAVASRGLTIRCQVPSKGGEVATFVKELKDWLIAEAKRYHGVELKRPAVERLLELLPTEVGILSQEVAKLSLLVDESKVIDEKLVQEQVGGWRTRKTWDMIDAAAAGNAADALTQLDRLIAAGEEPHAILPQMASTFRRFASAARAFERAERSGRKISLSTALKQSGMPPFKLRDAEPQLRQIGRGRAIQLYRWLLDADLALKGHNSTKERARREIETLIMRLSKQANEAVA